MVRIESINLSMQTYLDMAIGLPDLPLEEPLRMSGLGQCVVVAGKNGSGKTRLLSLLQEISRKYVSPVAKQQAEHAIAMQVTQQRSPRAQIAALEAQGTLDSEQQAILNNFRQALSNSISESERNKLQICFADSLIMTGDGNPNVILLVPQIAQLVDPSGYTEQDSIQRAKSFESGISVHESQVSAPSYARQLMRAAMLERSTCNGVQGPEQLSEARLLSIFDSLLGDDVKFKLDRSMNLSLEGVTDGYATSLSAGQMVLFQIACMLHAGHGALKDYIVFLDEPENHLHPSVLNDVVDRLRDVLTDGQLWIATHSVPLIAHLSAIDPNCLWFAQSGRFKPVGRTPSEVVHSLLGGSEGARRLNELTLLPSQYSSFLLLRQCLLPPGVIGYGRRDPQLSQIQNVLSKLRTEGRPLSVLDFGAGKGRLLDAIIEGASGRTLAEFVDYVAFEPYSPVGEVCARKCLEAYGVDERKRVFEQLDEATSVRGGKFADVAVVCNVLHEVRPSEWLGTFGGDSQLARALKDDGYVLFVEDYAIPVGERAHEYGFLLLDEAELRLLFAISESDVSQERFVRSEHDQANYEKRLVAHLVSARCLSRLTEQSMLNAIRCLHHRSLDRLGALLADTHNGATPALGRENALVTQLAANSALWLRDHQGQTTSASVS